MSAFLQNNITYKIGQWLIKKKLANYNRKVLTTNYGKVRTIGLLANAEEPDMMNRLNKQLKALKQLTTKATIEIIVFKKQKQEIVFAQKHNLIEVTKQDFDAFYLPKQGKLRSFCKQPFDLLIDCSLEDHLHLINVVALSKSSFKVGLASRLKQACFDFAISQPQEEKRPRFLSDLNHYLKILNANKHAA